MPFDLALMDSGRQCPAMSKRTGKRCRNFCSVGMVSCRIHGSGTMRAKVAAAERIRAAAGYAAALLVELMADPAVDVKLRADIAKDVLTRAGIEEAKRLQVEATIEAPWQKLLREGGLIKVVYTDDDAPNDAPRFDAAQAARRAEHDRPQLEMQATPVPPADSPAAQATYEANRHAPDPMPPGATQRVDGPRPRVRRKRA